jgi:hypothetical protein
MGPNCRKLLFEDQLIKLKINKINIRVIRLDKNIKIKDLAIRIREDCKK